MNAWQKVGLYDDKRKTSALRNHRYTQGLEATHCHGSTQDNIPASSKLKHGREEPVKNGSAFVFGPLEKGLMSKDGRLSLWPLVRVSYSLKNRVQREMIHHLWIRPTLGMLQVYTVLGMTP